MLDAAGGAFATGLDEARRHVGSRSHSRALPARRQVHLRRRAQPGRRRGRSRRRVTPSRRRRRSPCVLCVLRDKDWRDDDARAEPRRVALRAHHGADGAGQSRVGSGRGRSPSRASSDSRPRWSPISPPRSSAPRDRARDDARDRVVPHGGRCNGAVAGVAARRVDFRGWPRALSPVFAISIPTSSPSALTSWARGARSRAGSRSSSTTGRRSSRSSSTRRRAATRSSGSSTTSPTRADARSRCVPEMTPTLARMAAARANALRKPVRWFSMPQLFRYERQQRGRLREHFQLNVDIIGEAGRDRRRRAARGRDRDHARPAD